MRVCLRRTFHLSVQRLFDVPFFWEPPLHRFKGLVYRRLLGVKVEGDVMICQGVRILEPANLELGQRSYLAPGVRIEARREIRIGAATTIGPEAFITSGGHSIVDFSPNSRPVSIGSGVFVGARAIVLAGVEIGDNAIVGAGAVVARNVPPGTIVAGVPARVIRQRESTGRAWTVFGFVGREDSSL